MKFSKVNVIAYLVCLWLISLRSSYRFHPAVKRVMDHCFEDWVNWKTQSTMDDVDRQVEAIQDSHKDEQPVYTEHPPDGSKAQELLGGALQITAPHNIKKP